MPRGETRESGERWTSEEERQTQRKEMTPGLKKSEF